MSDSYESARKKFKPERIKVLFIAESPPPAAAVDSSRHFYRTEARRDDRLFVNTIKALYEDASELTEAQIEPDKKRWLERFAADGFFMIEALEQSQVHEVTKKERQERLKQAIPQLLKRVKELADKSTKIILIKSNVFEVCKEPLLQAGFTVLNDQLLDYPGRYNQSAFRAKLSSMLR